MYGDGMGSVYSVLQVNQYINNMFSQDYLLHDIYVRGEVSNCKYHSTGHVYFTLKEEGSAISCVLFAGYRHGVGFRLQDGQKVIVRGSVESYVRDGKYQIYVKSAEQDGEGDLYRAFETLKKKLAAQGMFDETYKRPIPRHVKTIGIVTAPTGAAVRDMISVSRRRNPYVQVVLFPAIVQGDAAPASITDGIQALEQYGVDLIIVGRGGGSMEDLWAFNDEMVAHAIFQCEVPVISAVGHETDFTIADFVADKRAATPSAAAELAVEDIASTERQISEYRQRLNRIMGNKITQTRAQTVIVRQKLQMLSPVMRVKEHRMNCIRFGERFDASMLHLISLKRGRLELLAERMNAVSPVKRLGSGLAYLSSGNGKRISHVKEIRAGDMIKIRMQDGEATAEIREVISYDGIGESINDGR